MPEYCSTSAPLDQVTPLILTYNEEPNIGRVLKGLDWAKRIVVVDSFSTDRTLDILAQHPKVEVVQRNFDTFASQCNAGLDLIKSSWVLSLDADYLITTKLEREMADAIIDANQNNIAGFSIPFCYCVFGKPLRGTILPPRIALFRNNCAKYIDDGHAHRLRLDGQCSELKSPIFHDDRKPLSRWLWAQTRYLKLEVDKLQTVPRDKLSLADRLRRRYVIAPFAVLLLCLIWKRGLLDGWRGWFYAFQRLYVETLLSLMLWEARHG